MREIGTLTVDSYVVRGGLVDGKLSRSLRKYTDMLASGVPAGGACINLSLCSRR
jgi:hypothetical protein